MIHSAPVIKYYPIVIIAAVEIATSWPYASDSVGVVLAMLGGGMMQVRRAEKESLPIKQVVAEWVLCGLAGFATHAIVISQLDSVRMVWTACIFTGCLGSEGLYKESQRRANKTDGN